MRSKFLPNIVFDYQTNETPVTSFKSVAMKRILLFPAGIFYALLVLFDQRFSAKYFSDENYAAINGQK